MKKQIYFWLICLFSALNISAFADTNVSGNITANTSWTAANSPYIVTGNVTVSNGITLQIESGVVVKFNNGTGLSVAGTLTASQVTFTSNAPTPTRGSWNVISVGNVASSLSLNSCVIEYATTAIVQTAGTVAVTNGIIENVNTGFNITTGTCTISGTTIKSVNNTGVYVASGACTVDGCTFENNPTAIQVMAGVCTVNNNSITGSSSSTGISIESAATVNLSGTSVTGVNYPIIFRGNGTLVNNGNNTFSGNARNCALVSFTNLTSNWTLPTLPIAYVMSSSFTIASAATLTVASNNIIKCGSWIYVDGVLNATANTGEQIIFTCLTNDNAGGDTNADGTATTPTRSAWGGVYFRNQGSNASVMKNCNLSYGGSGSRGGIVCDNANPRVESCTLENNYYGFELRNGAAPTITQNTIGSSQIVPIAMSFDANPVFTNNTFSLSDNQYDAIGLFGGTLTRNAHLKQRNVTGINNITYLMLDQLTVDQNISLTIDAGIVVKSLYYTHAITVKGSLRANGGADANRIIFTSIHDDNHGNPGDTNKNGSQTVPATGNWSGIVFEASSTNSKMEYCLVKYAYMSRRGYYSQDLEGSAIAIINASPEIKNCVTQNSGYGLIAFKAANPVLENVLVENTSSTPIAMSMSANPTVNNVNFNNAALEAIGIIGETVSVTGTLYKRNIASYNNISYVLLGNLTIASGIDLTISPGIVIKMNPGVSINVEGGLKAVGAANDSIVFTAISDDKYGNPFDTQRNGNATAPGKGNWNRIWFGPTTNDAFSTFSYCKIMYGGGGSGVNGMLVFSNADNKLSHVDLTDSSTAGISVEGSSAPDLTDNINILSCAGAPVTLSLTSNPTMSLASPMFYGNGFYGLRILEGNLASDATLTKRDVSGISNVAYITTGLTIAANATLTVERGVVVKLIDYYTTINVYGALKAVGTEAEPVVFTSIKDDSKGGDTNGDGSQTAPAKGNWWYIRFHNSNLQSQNRLENCIINYGGGFAGNPEQRHRASLIVENSNVTVNKCRIEQTGHYGIAISGSSTPTISNTEFNNIEFMPVAMQLSSNPVFSDNTMNNVGIKAIGLLPETYSSNLTVAKRDFGGYSNIPYYTIGTNTVNTGVHLTITAGIVFKARNASNYVMFEVNGRLSVNGTAAEPVIFANEADDSYGNPSDTQSDGNIIPNKSYMYTRAIVFNDVSNDLSLVNHAVFAYLDKGIDLLQASPTITNCRFENSNWGVVLNGVSEPTINNCAFNDLVYSPTVQSLVSRIITTDNATHSGNSVSGSTYRAIGILSEELVQDVTLTKKTFAGIVDAPYYFIGSYTVGSSVTLTIDPGVICKFNSRTLLSVKRGLKALGGSDPKDRIVFTSIYDDFYGGDTNLDGSATSGNADWYGIDFQSTAIAGLCVIDNAVISKAKHWDRPNAITTQSASPTISNTLFSDCGNGIVANGASNPVVSNCDFYNISNFAINNVNKSFNINATNCWWGDNSGPTHASNPGGIGMKISDMVSYTPFKTQGISSPILGDVSLNGLIQAYDASLVLQHTVGNITLNATQLAVADVTGDGSISALDASYVLKFAAGIINNLPGLYRAQAMSFELNIEPSDMVLGENNTVAIPLKISGAQNASALNWIFNYDNQAIKIVKVELGTDVDNFLFDYRIDQQEGKVYIALASPENFGIESEFVRITVEVLDNTHNGNTYIITEKLLINETEHTIPNLAIDISRIISSNNNMEVSSSYFTVSSNPTTSATTLSYYVSENNIPVRLSVFEINGKMIMQIDEGIRNTGKYTLSLAKLTIGGIYIIRMQAGDCVQTQKIIVK